MTTPVSMLYRSTIITPDDVREVDEQVAIETPFTVMLNEEEIGSSMVLPVDLEEFGAGFLFGRGYLSSPEELVEVWVCDDGRISVFADVAEIKARDVIITSGCGGTGAIPRDMLEGALTPPLDYSISFGEIKPFIRQALHASPLGHHTHCVHGCGLWADGELQVFFEDVGRHNAVDKMLGAILLGRAPARAAVFTTGRLTSDMVLKCARMRIPILISRTAPSSLGIAIAARAGLTLVAYAKPERLNVFCGAERIVRESK
jgi:FdhD protein